MSKEGEGREFSHRSRGSGKIWREASTFTARIAVPRAAVCGAHAAPTDCFEEGTLVASLESVFPVFLGDKFHIFILLKKGVLEEVHFLLSFDYL